MFLFLMLFFVFNVCFVLCFVHNVYNRNTLVNDIKAISGSSKEYAEKESGSVVIPIYVVQMPSESFKSLIIPYNQNYWIYNWGLSGVLRG
ncbi:hypothetical protein AS034_03000 [[Bacillus] enclensis]|nr:hypothetical protein AS034_03000 [[Bacillus] enclensis]